MRLMAIFVDSELAGSAGFADTINYAPGITARIAAARITLEKADHAERVLKLMGDFGADRGATPSTTPGPTACRATPTLGAARHGGDMRLAVFHYPIQGWIDGGGDERPAGPCRRRTLDETDPRLLRARWPRSSASSPRASSATRNSGTGPRHDRRHRRKAAPPQRPRSPTGSPRSPTASAPPTPPGSRR